MKIQVIIGILIVVSLIGISILMLNYGVMDGGGIHIADQFEFSTTFDCKYFALWNDNILIGIMSAGSYDTNILSLKFQSGNQSCSKTFNQKLIGRNVTELLVKGCHFSNIKQGRLQINATLIWKAAGTKFLHNSHGRLVINEDNLGELINNDRYSHYSH
jgi:hypothetical protein